MRLLVLSDLHHEAWRDEPMAVMPQLGGTSGDYAGSRPDVRILAGDIDVGDRAVAWADMAFPDLPVIYVHSLV